MGKQAGSSRTSNARKGNKVTNITNNLPKTIDETRNLNRVDTERALKAYNDIDERTRSEEQDIVRMALRNRAMLMGMVGNDADKYIDIINQVKVQSVSRKDLAKYEYITDGTSVYVVDRVNKDGSVRASRTIYETNGRGGVKATGDSFTFDNSIRIWRLSGSSAMQFDNLLTNKRRQYKLNAIQRRSS